MKTIISGAVAALAVLTFAGASQAQVVSNITVTTTGASPTTTAIYASGQPCVVGSTAAHAIESVTVTVSTTGAYTVTDMGPSDGGYAIYNGAFNPAAPATNCIASNDTAVVWTLTAGTYTFVGGPWVNGSPNGPYTMRFNGPGTVTLGAPPAPVPTLSEWAMILLGLMLAGGAALHLQRRRAFG
ncbi:IPTL-CTERM sorting domain-containing protein [Brevundimonas staleyi]|uniref:IPTL-CTERM sorting domain-containing protein n=1 Tax=Brevundimonas staleyi TaxID=74326 RepID=A0ABW0FWW5_9CAUL